MFKRLIRSLRTKPKDTRNTVAMVGAGIFTVVVFVGWLYLVPDALSGFGRITDGVSEGDAPFAQFFHSVKEQLSEAKAVVSVDEEMSVDSAGAEQLSESSSVVRTASSSAVSESQILPAASSSPLESTPRPVRIITTPTTTASTTTP